MESLSKYKIKFSGLKDGTHNFSFDICDSFFSFFKESEVKSGSASINVEMEKRPTHLILNFEIEGVLSVICDRCLDLYKQEIETEASIVVKFSSVIDDDNDEIIYLSHEAYEIELAQLIYEYMLLAIPFKRVHPDGECNPDMMDRISGFDVDDMSEYEEMEEEEEIIDPRWAKLKSLKK